MKQLALPLAAAAAIVTGCSAVPNSSDTGSSTPKPMPRAATTERVDYKVDMTFTDANGVKKEVSHVIEVDKSTVARPKATKESNASVGDAWWGNKAGDYKPRAVEQSSYKQNIDMGVVDARQQGLDGTGVTVAIVDTGIKTDAAFSEIEKDRIIGESGTPIALDHATHVANLAVGTKNGVAPRAKVFDAKSNGESRAVSRIISDASEVVDIINYSGNSAREADNSEDSIKEAKMMQTAFTKAIKDKGALIVQSVGNEGRKNPNAHAHLIEIDPELQKGLMLVTAVNSTQNKTLGVEKDGKTVWANQCGSFADYCMAAPGFYTYKATSSAYGYHGGTSFAAPRVSGAAALIKQKYPWASNDMLRTTLLTTADDMGDKEKFGWGMLNIAKAINGPAKLPFGELETNVTPGVYSFSNDISGTGSLLKTGKGTLNLDGVNSFTGGIKVQDGTLNINRGYVGTATVSNNATVGGEGMARRIVSTGGKVDLQDGLAIIDLKLDDKSTTRVRAGRTAKVLGTAELGGKLEVSSLDKSYHVSAPSNTTAAIVTNGLKGKFDGVTTSLMYDPSVTYGTKDVYITLKRKDANEVRNTVNSAVSDVALEAITAGASKVDQAVAQGNSTELLDLHDSKDIKTVVNSLYSLSDSVYANSMAATQQQLSAFGNTIQSATANAVSKNNYGMNDGISAVAYGGYGEANWQPTGDLKGDFAQNNYGVGLSWVHRDKAFSVVASQHDGDWSENFDGSHIGKAESKTTGVQVHASKSFDDLTVTVSGAGFRTETEVDRNINTVSAQNAAKGEQTNHFYQLGVTADKNIPHHSLDVNVKAGVRAERTLMGAVTEATASSLGLANGKSATTVTIGTLSGTVGKVFDTGLISHMNAGVTVEHKLSDAMLSDAMWDVAKTRYKAEANLGMRFGHRVSGLMNVSHTHTDAYKDTAANVGLKFDF